jgi:hypothetical protein
MLGVAPLANGLSTDHPVPSLPFVDDLHIPVDDPEDVEGIGRGRDENTWGRFDFSSDGQRWWAFTTDPRRPELAWAIHYHPDHGRTVVLVRDEDAAGLHELWAAWDSGRPSPLLFRSGGYWWDGTTWYRPRQVIDTVAGGYALRPVAGAETITAAHQLASAPADSERGRLLSVEDVQLDGEGSPHWLDDLALWEHLRTSDGRPLENCVISLHAPELAADQLINATQLAAMAGLAPGTVRGYRARGEGLLPDPQMVLGGRTLWSRPVAADWVEARDRSAAGIGEVLAASPDNPMPRGIAALFDRLTEEYTHYFWGVPKRRRWWVIGQRNKETVTAVARDLALFVINDLDRIADIDNQRNTLFYALRDQLRRGERLRPSSDWIVIAPSVAKSLDWLIAHYPPHARSLVGEVVGEADRSPELELDRATIARTLRECLRVSGRLPAEVYDGFFERALPTELETTTTQAN